jgi:hypothetical protein
VSKIAKRLICLFIIIIIVLISPLIVGKITQMQFTKLINNLNYLEKNKGIHLELLNYQQGWLKSKATFKISINKAKYYKEEVTIYNGPYIFNSSVHSFKDHFNLAYFEGNFNYGAINIQDKIQVDPIKFNYIGSMKYNLSSSFMISFDKFAANLINDDISDPSSFTGDISVQKGGVLTFTTNPSVKTIKINSKLNEVKFNYNMAFPVDKNNMQRSFENISSIRSIDLSSTSSNVFEDSWQTNNSITEHDVHGTTNIYKNNIFDTNLNKKPTQSIITRLKKGTINFAKQINLNNNSVNAYFKVFANKANVKILSKDKIKHEYNYDPIDFKIGIYNINFHNLLKLENLMKKSNKTDAGNDDFAAKKTQRMALYKQAISLINEDTALKVEYGHIDGNKKLFINTTLNWPTINPKYISSVFSLIPTTQTKTNISISKALLSKNINLIAKTIIPYAIKDDKEEKLINKQKSSSTADKKAQAKPDTYKDPKLEFLTGLKNIPVTTPNDKLITATQKQLKVYLNQLVSNGYIDIDKDYYQTVLESKGPIITANGIIVNTNYLASKLN